MSACMCLSVWTGLRRPRGERVSENENEWPDRETRTTVGQTVQNATHVDSNFSLLPGNQSFLAVSGQWPLAPALSPAICPLAPSPLSPSALLPPPPGPRHQVRFRVDHFDSQFIVYWLFFTHWFKGRICAKKARENEASCRCLSASRHHILCLLFSVINCRTGCPALAWLTDRQNWQTSNLFTSHFSHDHNSKRVDQASCGSNYSLTCAIPILEPLFACLPSLQWHSRLWWQINCTQSCTDCSYRLAVSCIDLTTCFS